MALFMVLFSISSVNISKYVNLQQSLQAAFSGSILSGGRSILQSGSQSSARHSVALTADPSDRAADAERPAAGRRRARPDPAASRREAQAASQEQRTSRRSSTASTVRQGPRVRQPGDDPDHQQGLVVTVLTDKLLFDSGSASLKPAGCRCSTRSATCSTSTRCTTRSWSRASPTTCRSTPRSSRATGSCRRLARDTVLRYLLGRGIPSIRFGAAGYADLHPVASNATPTGRALNRRVEIVFERIRHLTSRMSQ